VALHHRRVGAVLVEQLFKEVFSVTVPVPVVLILFLMLLAYIAVGSKK
jgi:hypothetical protein